MLYTMKKLSYLLIVACLIANSGCKKDDDKISKVVTLPYIQLNGSKYITMNVGGDLSDAGAKIINDVTLSGGTSDLTAVTNTLDPTTPGLYYMLYEAETQNGYHLYEARYIAVTNYADNAKLAGAYKRTSNGIEVNVTKESRALYQVDDGGGAGLPDAVYFAVINDTTIDVGPQFSESKQTEIYGNNSKLTMGATDTTFRYVLHSPGYGTAVRTFKKVH